MRDCTVTRTHRRGQKLAQRDWEKPLAGPVGLSSIHHETLGRVVQYLRIERAGPTEADIIPPLLDPHWLAFSSGQGMMVAGFEEISRSRYYQGWYVRWA